MPVCCRSTVTGNLSKYCQPRVNHMPERNDIQRFVGEIGAAIAAAFDSEQYRDRVESLQEEEKHREEDALRQLGDDRTSSRTLPGVMPTRYS